jgi:hypothetical protein
LAKEVIAMSDESAQDAINALVPRTEHIVDFYGEPITVALVGDTPYVALRTFTDYLGLDWSAQRQRTERDEVLSGEVRPLVMTGADGKQREMLCLPLEFLPGWLFGSVAIVSVRNCATRSCATDATASRSSGGRSKLICSGARQSSRRLVHQRWR